MARPSVRRVALSIVLVLFLALLTDRIALYEWGVGVRNFHRSLHQNVDLAFKGGDPGISITEAKWDEIPFVLGEGGPSGINFMKSSVRPDVIETLEHEDKRAIRLWYLPPPLAWTTRLFPFYSGSGSRPRSYRPVDHYQYMLAIYGKEKWSKPLVELYSGPEQKPVPLTATRPEVFP